MDPLDLGKNVEVSGSSKRRISSILKAPRKSSVLQNLEQQNNEVESDKPVEKRNSRRVSFAPDNDVVLFAKEPKNVSSPYNPLELLLGAATGTTQNRVQVLATEDESPQILGMETLLNAPLHASQQRIMVPLDSGIEFAEKTVLFCAEDAVMDLTHSHSINLNIGAELLGDLSHENFNLIHSGGEGNDIEVFRDVASSHSVQATNPSTEKRPPAHTMSHLDPDFKSFLLSLSKPSASSTSAVLTGMTALAGPSSDETKSSSGKSETQTSDVDKENQVPNSLSSSRKSGEAFSGSAFHPEVYLSMDLTEAQTGHILGVAADEDPFQCLFPTQDMYEMSNRRESDNLKANKSLVNPSVAAPHESQKVSSVLKKDSRETTVGNGIDLRFTEFPVSLPKTSGGNPENPRIQPPFSTQTVGTGGSLSQHELWRTDVDQENCPARTRRSWREPLSVISPEGDISMEMTAVQTGHIMGGDVSMEMTDFQTGRITEILPLCESQKKEAFTLEQQNIDRPQSSHQGMETSKTSGGNPENPRIQPPSSTQTVGTGGSLSQHELWRTDVDQENCPARTRRSCREPLSVISPEGDISMEMTAVQTGHIMGGDVSMEMTDFQTGRITEILPLCGSQKKEAFTLEQQNIDRPQSSHQGMETSSKLSFNIRHQDKVVPADGSREKTSTCLDVTKSHGVYITANVKPDSHPNVNVSPTGGEKTVRFTADDASRDITQCVNMRMATGLESDWITSVTEKDQDGLLTRLPSRNDCNADPVCAGMTAVTSESPAGFPVYQEDDMDITQAQTGCVLGAEASVNVTGVQTGRIEETAHKQEPPQAVLLTGGAPRQSGHDVTERKTQQQRSEASGGSNSADSLMKTSLKTTVQRNQVEFDSKYDCREAPVRFTASGGCMDATQYDTVDMTCDLSLRSLPNVVLSSNGEKTVRFNANDADIDVTKSHTVRIVKGLPPKCSPNAVPPADGEKTLGFDTMDVTASQVVNIVKSLPLKCSSNAVLPAGGEKTVRFHATDAEMDMTKSHTVALQSFPNAVRPSNGEKPVLSSANDATDDVATNKISTDLQSHQNENMERNWSLLARQKGDLLPADGERTVWFDVNEAEMDVTRCHTMILQNSIVVPDQLFNQSPSEEENQAWLTTNGATLDVTPSSPLSRVTGFDQKPDQIIDSLSANPERINYTLVDETESETKSILKNAKRASQSNVEFLLAPADKAAKPTTNDAAMDTTRCRSVHTVGNQLVDPVLSDENTPFIRENTSVAFPMKESASGKFGLDSNPSSSAQSAHSTSNDFLFQPSCAEVNPQGDVDAIKVRTLNKTHTEEINASMDMSEECLGSSTYNPPQGVASKQDPLSKSFKEPGLTLQSGGALGSPVSVPENKENQPEEEARAVSHKMESSPSTADQNADGPPSQASRRRSLANLTSRVKRLSQLIKAAPATDDCTAALPHPDSDLDKSPERKTPSAVEPELEMSLGNNTNDGEAQNPTEAEHPSVATSSKTKRLMSRLTMGGFKPKLPKRNDADESTKASFEGDPAKTPAVDVTQQLSRFDQIGNIQDEELVDFEDLSESVDVTIEKECPSSEFDVSEPLEDGGVVEDVTIGRSQRQKRPAVDNDWEERKRLKTDTEFFGTALQPDVDGESSVATDGSSHRSETASRCHTASESTCKNSLFESQLEDCVSDGLKKLEDGTITVLEFFNLFSIDFVINNPRQSVVSGRLLANEDVTPLDLLKDKYISRPKQQVYETDAKTLTGKIEGLKHRKQDLNKPLKTLNRPLWEEVKNFTEEELKSFGAKLKEQNNFFRKQSRVQTHEMKEVLYSSLVLANLEEKQKVLEKMNQADEMIQTLDSCIAEVEAELNAIEEKGSEDKPGLKSLQEEMSKVTEALADRERQICELDLEKKKNSSDAVRLSAEARDLQSHLDTLYMLTEWRLEEQDDSSVFSFLNGTFFLLLEYEKTSGNDAGSKPEKKLTNIGFEFNLNEEMSQCYARLVHKLLSQHIQGESGWLEKYPTSGDVPQLLHDVSLVVSRCRLLGEEVRLLKTWGSLRFDILDMSCSGSHVHVVFSSLKAFSKFEVVFAAQLINKLCVFHVQSFKNVIGNTTIQQIEDIVASLSPGRDLFTRIIKKLHATLLS